MRVCEYGDGEQAWGPTIPQHSQVLEQRLYLTPQGKRKSERMTSLTKITQAGWGDGRCSPSPSSPSPGKGAARLGESRGLGVGAQIPGGLARVACKVSELS